MCLHLQTLLPLFLPLAANPLLLRSLSAAILLLDRPRVNRPWWRRLTLPTWTVAARRPHNPLFQLNQLLFFFFPALKVNLDQGLELHQVLLHPFTMDILQRQEVHTFAIQIFKYKSITATTWGTNHVHVRGVFISFSFSRTSKSTFSPSGIFGGIRLGIINVLKLKTIRLHTAFQGRVFTTVTER